MIFILSYCFILLSIYQCKCCENKYIQLSASTIKYISYLPLVTQAWNRIGFYVIIYITYHNLNDAICIVKEKLKYLKCSVILLQFNKSQSLHYISKMSRIFGFMVTRKNCISFFYLSDSDIVPISKSYFSKVYFNKLAIKSFDKNGYGYGNNKGKWAMCYMVANRRIWENILKDDIIPNNIKGTISSVILLELKKGEKYFEKFNYLDEVYLRDKIRSWKYFNENVIFDVRKYKHTRINRNKLTNTSILNMTNVIDIHLPTLTENIINKWETKIIPLQKVLFNSVPYDLLYIKSLFATN